MPTSDRHLETRATPHKETAARAIANGGSPTTSPARPTSRRSARTGCTKDNQASVAAGLSATARVISCAALTMTSVFLAFLLSTSVVVKMLALGLGVSVLVDATIIRLLVVFTEQPACRRCEPGYMGGQVLQLGDLGRLGSDAFWVGIARRPDECRTVLALRGVTCGCSDQRKAVRPRCSASVGPDPDPLSGAAPSSTNSSRSLGAGRRRTPLRERLRRHLNLGAARQC